MPRTTWTGFLSPTFTPHQSDLLALLISKPGYLLPFTQFLYGKRMANPALEKASAAPPENISVHFEGAGMVVVGSGLKQLERWLQA